MFKQITVVVCDLCGKLQEAKVMNDWRNEPVMVTPTDWLTSPVNHNVHLCPNCAEKLNRKEMRHGR